MDIQENYENFFIRYGAPSDEGAAEIRLYYTRPEKIDTLDRIMRADQYAAEDIERLELYIEILKHYRQELCKQYNELVTAATVPGIKLVRERQCWNGGKVLYRMTWYTHYIDSGLDVTDRYEVYKGTERHKAISDYRDYVKSHPGILATMQIEKAKWEK